MISAYDFDEEFRKVYGAPLHPQAVETVLETAEEVKEEMLEKDEAAVSYINSVGTFLERWLENCRRSSFGTFAVNTKSKKDSIYGRIELVALDPRVAMKDIVSSVFASISMSGTLSPIDAYVEQLDLNARRTETLKLPSPYSPKNVTSYIVQGLTTRYADRGPEMYQKMAETIAAIASATPKNVGIFSTSYVVLDGLLKSGLEHLLTKPLYASKSGMDSRSNDALVRNFKKESEKHGAVLLGVLGGRSSEGSDFPGDFMNAVIIVGIPLARPTPRVEASIRYLEEQFPGKGKEYGYIIPAMTRAAQATGRPIRSLTDRAAIILMDERFASPYYRRYLPEWVVQNVRMAPPEPDFFAHELNSFFYDDVLDSFDDFHDY